jgi:hypothetical protein
MVPTYFILEYCILKNLILSPLSILNIVMLCSSPNLYTFLLQVLISRASRLCKSPQAMRWGEGGNEGGEGGGRVLRARPPVRRATNSSQTDHLAILNK